MVVLSLHYLDNSVKLEFTLFSLNLSLSLQKKNLFLLQQEKIF